MRKLAFLIASTLAMPIGAQSTEDFLKCSAIEDSVKRLDCFDSLTSKEQAKKNKEAEEKLGSPQPIDSWDIRIEQSPVDDSKTVILRSAAKDKVPGKYGRGAVPFLYLRCLQNTTAAYIHFDDYFMADIQGYGKVTFRVDKNKPFSKNLTASTNSKSLGLWRGGGSIPFIKQLFGGESLLIQATPYSDSAITFTVDISGIEEAVKPLREACGW